MFFIFLSFLPTYNLAFLFSVIMAKFNYKSVKKAQGNKVEKVKVVEAQAGRPRARSMPKLKTTGFLLLLP